MRNHFATAFCSTIALGFVVFTIASCAPQKQTAAPRAPQREHMAEDHHVRPPAEDIREVMSAKLAHTQAIVEGLALGDLEQVRANAVRLERVSEESAWMVHDTMAYIVLSDDFRRLTRRMADNAASGNMDAVVVDYTALTHSCVNCHSYLQREREAGQLPGRLSRALNWSDDIAPVLDH